MRPFGAKNRVPRKSTHLFIHLPSMKGLHDGPTDNYSTLSSHGEPLVLGMYQSGSPLNYGQARPATDPGTRKAFHKHVCWTDMCSRGPASSQEIQKLRRGVPSESVLSNRETLSHWQVLSKKSCSA